MTKPRYRLKVDGTVMQIDGLQNLTANLGTSRDKAAASFYGVPTLTDDQLVNAYRGTWLARKIVDIPAFDACRKWRAWQAKADQITAIEAEEKRLGLQGKVLRAKVAARLLGGAALLIGTGDSDTAQPLDPGRVKKGGLRYVTLLHRRHLSATDIVRDPTSPYFDQPKSWRLNTERGNGLEIHPSRLVILKGSEVPDEALSTHTMGWSDPVLLGIMEAVRNMDATAANVASLVFEAKVDTVGIPDFMARLSDPGFEAKILQRFRLAEMGKGINGTLIHDKDEELGQKQASFASLADIMDRFMQLAAGAADIPMTRLLGQSPGGMNATGDSDMRNYYDRVAAMQALELDPAMHVLNECLIRSALGARPEEIHATWHSLWQMTDAERATIGKTQADTVKVLHDTGLIPDEALAESAVNLMTESGAMPGLEGAVATYFAEHPEGEEDDDGLDPDGAGDVPEPDPDAAAGPGTTPRAKAAPVTDAAPRALYVSRKVTE